MKKCCVNSSNCDSKDPTGVYACARVRADVGNQSQLATHFRSDPTAKGRKGWRDAKCLTIWVEHAPREKCYLIGRMKGLGVKREACKDLMIQVLKVARAEKKKHAPNAWSVAANTSHMAGDGATTHAPRVGTKTTGSPAQRVRRHGGATSIT